MAASTTLAGLCKSDRFLTSLDHIYGYTASEIIANLMEHVGSDIFSLRKEVFRTLVKELHLTGFSLSGRNDMAAAAKDVYVMGLSLQEQQLSEGMMKILRKTNPPPDSVNPWSPEKISSFFDEFCAMKQQLAVLTERVNSLEAENCVLKKKITVVVPVKKEDAAASAPPKTWTKIVEKQPVKGISHRPVADVNIENNAVASNSSIVTRRSTQDKSNSDNSGWMTAGSKKRRVVKRGTAEEGGWGAPGRFHLYVGRILPSTSDAVIRKYLTERNVNVLDLQVLATSEYSQSIHLTVSFEDKIKVLNEAFWPAHVVYRRFFPSRNPAVNPGPSSI